MKFLHYLPRILAVVFTVFLSIFAFDVFGEYSGSELPVALFLHLVPTFVLIAVTTIAWKWEFAGGILFIALGVFALFFFNHKELASYFIIQGPVFLIGILFISNHLYKRR